MTGAFTAYATRSEGWWAVSVPAVDLLFTQTRHLAEIPEIVRDALSLFPEYSESATDAEIPVIPTEAAGSLPRSVTCRSPRRQSTARPRR